MAEKKVTRKIAKQRKPYPTKEERLVNVDKVIDRYSKLVDDRTGLVEKTRSQLVKREEALAKAKEALDKAQNRKERLSKTPAEAKAKKAEYNKLIAFMKESGKSVDEIIASLKQ